ncbi:MAG TPA: hypothetical protein VEB21_03045, partial [Terriglobales bacterium]|nr:hypothetical protein [Terriglobales bacterium]
YAVDREHLVGTQSNWRALVSVRGEQRRAEPKRGAAAVAAPAMIEVISRNSFSDGGFVLHLGDGRWLKVPASFDAAGLRQLLHRCDRVWRMHHAIHRTDTENQQEG